MTYRIEHSNGEHFDLLQGGPNSTQTSLTLLGQGTVNYGRAVAENFVHLLENFAHTEAPEYPLVGQLWYKSDENILQIYTGKESGWTGANGLKVGNDIPNTCDVAGELFFREDTKRLYICDGSRYVPVSPPFISESNTGFTIIEDKDDSDNVHHVLIIVADGVVLGAWSGAKFNPTFSGDVQIGSDTVNIDMSASFSGSTTGGLSIGLTLAGNISAIEFHGKATSAEYSDLAERYQTDITVEPGDLVKIGGSFEITKTRSFKDPDVFGVISTEPAIMMNSSAGSDSTHPYVALSGRVPCKVKGFAKRGDRLVSSSIPGVAEAISNKQDIDFYTIFGRVLQDKMSEGIEVVEVIVGVK